MKQSTRIEIARSTLEIIDKGFYLDSTGKRLILKKPVLTLLPIPAYISRKNLMK